jgi:hypothetical protein
MVSDDEVDREQVVPLVVNKRKKPSDVSGDTIKSIISFLIIRSENVDGVVRPARGAQTEAANWFNLSTTTISRIWIKAKGNYEDPDVAAFRASPKKKGRTAGVPYKWDREQVELAIVRLTYQQRRTIRSMADALSMPKSTLFDIYKNDNIIRCTKSTIKPHLTDHNKWLRVKYAFDRINGYNNEEDKMCFDPSLAEVHVDEKWGFLTELAQKVYLTEGEVPVERYTTNSIERR